MFQILPTGQRLTREIINNIPRFVLSMIRPGPGIRIFPSGDGGLCISTDMVTAGQGRQSMGGGGGGGGSVLYLGKFASLNSDGNTLAVYLYNYDTEAWATSTTNIYKPVNLRYDTWNGKTLTYADTTQRTYDASGLFKQYQRRASWVGGNTEIQYITEMYYVDEILHIEKTQDGIYVDKNNAGRGWAANII